MTAEAIHAFLERDLLSFNTGVTLPAAGYVLPPASLALIGRCLEHLGVRRVFEFGTGLSTELFLGAGCHVTAIEDGERWLAEVIGRLDADVRDSFVAYRLPLRRVWLRGAPIQSWTLPAAALNALREADFVLIDSPALPPFREHALALALRHATGALIVVDDANIPTVARFCRRLAERNGAAFAHLPLDHGLFFCGPAACRPLRESRPFIETLKAWRRYFHPRAGA